MMFVLMISLIFTISVASLTTLMKMSKSSGELLKPHITTLVTALLESISTLEPQLLNYLSLHAASNQSTLDMVSIFLSNVNMSHYM